VKNGGKDGKCFDHLTLNLLCFLHLISYLINSSVALLKATEEFK
jgi:hypothetical protein